MSLIPKTCFFTGHRIIALQDINTVKSLLRGEILTAMNNGFTVFIAGGALGFDSLAAEQVIDMRKEYDMIRLCLYLPCTNQSEKWTESEKIRYSGILSLADEIYYVSRKKYSDGCMKKRNRAMVEASDMCIAYMKNNSGGTWQTVKMAEEKGIPIVNIAKIIDKQNSAF